MSASTPVDPSKPADSGTPKSTGDASKVDSGKPKSAAGPSTAAESGKPRSNLDRQKGALRTLWATGLAMLIDLEFKQGRASKEQKAELEKLRRPFTKNTKRTFDYELHNRRRS
jgi:hypothetical protein